MAPGIPGGGAIGRFAGEAGIFGKWAEIAVVGMKGNELLDKFFEMRAEARIVVEAEHERAGGEIFAGEFARPWQQIAIGLLIAIAEHLEHGRIVDGSTEQPVL